jgi:hypothetical protein
MNPLTNTDSNKHFQNALVMTTALCAKLFSEYRFGFNCKGDSLEMGQESFTVQILYNENLCRSFLLTEFHDDTSNHIYHHT